MRSAKHIGIAAALFVSATLLALPLRSGEQWKNEGGPGGCNVYALAASGSYLFAGTELGAYVSTDYGRHWFPAGETGPAALGEAAVRGILISRSDIYALTEQGVSLSTDRGAGWTSLKTGLPDGSGVSCLLEAGSALYCGLSEGAAKLGWRSTSAPWGRSHVIASRQPAGSSPPASCSLKKRNSSQKTAWPSSKMMSFPNTPSSYPGKMG